MLAPLLAAAIAAVPVAPTAAAKDVVDAMTLPGMHVGLRYIDCGFINAFYAPTDDIGIFKGVPMLLPGHTVFICNEVLQEPLAFVRFVVAHEMSHAIVDQYGIPVTGSQEAAADELAAVSLIALGFREDVGDAGLWHAGHPGTEDPMDEHPSNNRRAWTLTCYADGAKDDGSRYCKRYFRTALVNWTRLIATFHKDSGK